MNTYIFSKMTNEYKPVHSWSSSFVCDADLDTYIREWKAKNTGYIIVCDEWDHVLAAALKARQEPQE